MPRIFQALMLCCAASVISTLPAAARDYPFCIKGAGYGSAIGDCSFDTYEQCQASASGRDAYCDANPYFNANAELQPDRTRQSRRRF